MSFMNLLATCVVVGGGTMAVMGRYTLGGFLHGVAQRLQGRAVPQIGLADRS